MQIFTVAALALVVTQIAKTLPLPTRKDAIPIPLGPQYERALLNLSMNPTKALSLALSQKARESAF